MSEILSHQFNNAADIEAEQRKRFKRRAESGFSGAGFWYANYPGMVGAIGAGNMTQTQSSEEAHETPGQELSENTGQGAADTSGMGDGGTASSAAGAAGGTPA